MFAGSVNLLSNSVILYYKLLLDTGKSYVMILLLQLLKVA